MTQSGIVESAAFAATTEPAAAAAVDLLFIPVFQDDTLDDVPGLDEATGGEVARARASGEFRAKLYDVFVTPIVGGSGSGRTSFRRRLGGHCCRSVSIN